MKKLVVAWDNGENWLFLVDYKNETCEGIDYDLSPDEIKSYEKEFRETGKVSSAFGESYIYDIEELKKYKIIEEIA